jgi:hypothetical protein
VKGTVPSKEFEYYRGVSHSQSLYPEQYNINLQNLCSKLFTRTVSLSDMVARISQPVFTVPKRCMSEAVSALMNRLKQWFPKWAVPLPEGGGPWDYPGGDKGQGVARDVQVGPSKRVVRLFTIEVTSG